MTDLNHARQVLTEWKGADYAFGFDVVGKTGEYAAQFGKRALVVASLGSKWARPLYEQVARALDRHGVAHEAITGARPNAPYEDVYRIANEISKMRPDVVVAVGGGSTIDGAKAASVLAAYSPAQVREHLGASPELASTAEPYFGVGFVSAIREKTGISAAPVIAVQTAASSAAHLTKYANITNPETGQKKLFVDMAVVPPRAVFDYGLTVGAPRDLTLDGGLDGMSHLWEVFTGANGRSDYGLVKEIAAEGIALIVESLPEAIRRPDSREAREALGAATDLGGYAIMIGSTNGAHLGSFSLVDVTSHGRACAILNPYYTVLFSPVIGDQLRSAGEIFRKAGYLPGDPAALEGRELGMAVAQAMIAFSKTLGAPTSLREAGATETHLNRMLTAAKNPQLSSKMKSMPIPLDPANGDVEHYMQPTLEAAFTGDLSKIRLIGS